MSSRNKTSGKGYGKDIRSIKECLQHVMGNINDLMQSGLTLFFYDNASTDVAGYLQLNTGVPTTAAADVVLSPTADNEEMEQWASENALGVEFMFAGQMDIHFHGHKTVKGTHDTAIYFKVYHRTTGAAETLIGTSNHSAYLTTVSTNYDVMIHIDDTVIAVTDRLVVKAFAHLSGSGGDPVIHFEVEGTGASAKMTHVSLPGISANDSLELHKASPHTAMANGTYTGDGVGSGANNWATYKEIDLSATFSEILRVDILEDNVATTSTKPHLISFANDTNDRSMHHTVSPSHVSWNPGVRIVAGGKFQVSDYNSNWHPNKSGTAYVYIAWGTPA